jgi:peptidyl-prolyl cis-trans isomerase C
MPQPVESRYGYHIVYIARKVPGQLLPFSAVEQKIADYLNEKVRRKAVAQYIHTLIVDAEIDGYDFNLSASPLMQ